ncbi:glycine-rich domain-containing protein [Amycolatopsis thailandensis]|uniref:glycine-rich domain-containing protein n=1 Tax=Amycolatopsis thailandensis TaxID=589330 RepID=UPI003644A2B8
MTIAVEELTGQGLVSADLFDRLVTRIAKEHDMKRELATRIVDQALAFLRASGEYHRAPLGPSELVDIGWHTFILYTREYADFCNNVVGKFIHHVPNDDGEGEADPTQVITRTKDAIRDLGFAVDDDLWLAFNLTCNSGDKGCRSSGADGNENTDTNTSDR